MGMAEPARGEIERESLVTIARIQWTWRNFGRCYSASSLLWPLFLFLSNDDVFSCRMGITGDMVLKII